MCLRWYRKLETYLDFGDPLAISEAPSNGAKAAGNNSFLAEDSEEDSPGPIDLSSLLDRETGDLRSQMIDMIDYRLVNEAQWRLILENFGLSEGQEPIERRVITHGLFTKHNKVEVYYMPLELELYDRETVGKKKASFSKMDPVRKFLSSPLWILQFH